MKILIYGINYSPELTGIGKYTGEMSAWLASRGHEVRVVTAPPYYPEWRVAEGYSSFSYRRQRLNGVDVWRCPLWVPETPSGAKRIVHLASFALSSSVIMLRQALWKPDVDTVVEPPLFCAPTNLIVSWLCGARSWLHVQDFEVDAAFDLGVLSSPRLRRIVLKIENWLMSKFDRVSTVFDQMILRLGTKSVLHERSVLFPNWADTDRIYPRDLPSTFREQLGISASEIVFLYNGN